MAEHLVASCNINLNIFKYNIYLRNFVSHILFLSKILVACVLGVNENKNEITPIKILLGFVP